MASVESSTWLLSLIPFRCRSRQRFPPFYGYRSGFSQQWLKRTCKAPYHKQYLQDLDLPCYISTAMLKLILKEQPTDSQGFIRGEWNWWILSNAESHAGKGTQSKTFPGGGILPSDPSKSLRRFRLSLFPKTVTIFPRSAPCLWLLESSC